MPAPQLQREVRPFVLQDPQIRAATSGGRLAFTGQAVVYNQLSDDLGGWRERIFPGSATETLSRSPDVRFLLNHNPDKLLARTVSGTLRLADAGDEGLNVDADMANVSYARDVAELIERGDLTQMSFGFWVLADGWAGNVHEVYKIELDGGDVSVVTYPAFPQTSAGLAKRAADQVAQLAPDADLGDLQRRQHRARHLGLLAQL